MTPFASSAAVFVRAKGGPEELTLVYRPDVRPEFGDVTIKVEAAGVAYADALMRAGRYPGGPKPPFVPGWDVLGIVEAVGPGGDTTLVGARVLALTVTGGYAERVIAPAARVVRLPDGLDPYKAACLTMNYVTAMQMLRLAGASPGRSLLVHGAAGGVGSALLDLARSQGLEAWGAASPSNRDRVESYGARFIDRTLEDPGVQLKRAGSGGVDMIFDPLGGPNTRRSFAALRPGGTVVSYGFIAASSGRPALLTAMLQMIELRVRSLIPDGRRGVFYRLSNSVLADPPAFRADLKALLSLLAAERISPALAGVLPLSQAAEAHRRLERGEITGRLLLVPYQEQTTPPLPTEIAHGLSVENDWGAPDRSRRSGPAVWLL